ncbi:Parathyroid hormone [Nibea albiflora]|uniref:Parathyroid hormone n=1 Tax=Nibea albiflora TaxID=240163 RepID=A0ACB7FEC3_NIBAL|nr:Parathyroid hormone [Nibea albiflora]
MRHLDFFFISLCVLHLFTLCDGRPLRKRTVSEVQLMHDVREHKQVKERKEWLLTWLEGIHAAPAAQRGRSSSNSTSGDSSEEATRRRRRLSPEQLSDMSGVTPEEIHALDFSGLELLQSEQA